MSRKKNWEKKKKFSKGKQIKKDKFKLKKRDLREFEKQGLIKEGTFIGNQKGFGFVELEDEEDDIFIPANSVGTAMHQDTVRVLVKKKSRQRKASGGHGCRNPGAWDHGGRGYFPERTGLWICTL